jgi:hypothetical protein
LRLNFILALLLLAVLCGCNPNKIGPQSTVANSAPLLGGAKVLVLNEGNFGRGNASVSAYFYNQKQVNHGIYSRFNGGLPLGDVLQDFIAVNGNYYLSLNASGKIVALDTAQWLQTESVENLATPRYLASGGQRLFGTDLFQNQLYVFSLSPLHLDTTLALPSAGGKMVTMGNHLYVAAGKQLVKINRQSLEIDTAYTFTFSFTEIVNASGKIWILKESAPAALWTLDVQQNTLLEIKLPESGEARFLRKGTAANTLFFFQNQQVWQVNPTEPHRPKALFKFSGTTAYGFNIHPQLNQVYVADALDYNQASDIYRYDLNGNIQDQFKGGLITNGFFFTN